MTTVFELASQGLKPLFRGAAIQHLHSALSLSLKVQALQVHVKAATEVQEGFFGEVNACKVLLPKHCRK